MIEKMYREINRMVHNGMFFCMRYFKRTTIKKGKGIRIVLNCWRRNEREYKNKNKKIQSVQLYIFR